MAPARKAGAGRDDRQGGTYRLELVRCGKPNCTRCADGPAHGPYWYRYYRGRGGKVVSKYVGKDRPGASGRSAAPPLLQPPGTAAAAGPAPAERLAAGGRQNLLDLARDLGLDYVTDQDSTVAVRTTLERVVARQAAGGAAAVPVAAGAGPDEVRGAVRAAYENLARYPADYVEVRELRDLLPGVPRERLDAELAGMYRDHAVILVGKANQEALLKADREAAVHMGEFIGDKHMISISRNDEPVAGE
jgi:hypothetical protein